MSIGWYYFCYDKVDKLTATGTIEVTKYDVTPRLAGYIRNLKLKEGDSLNLGDFVCEIEREDLRAQNIGDWQAVKEAQAKLQDLKDGARKQEIAMAENSLQKAQVQETFADQAQALRGKGETLDNEEVQKKISEFYSIYSDSQFSDVYDLKYDLKNDFP